MSKLNLGAGEHILKGYDNHDITNNIGIDLVFNFNEYPYPIKSNTYDFIMLEHCLQYVKDFELFFKEIHRISKDECKIKIIVGHQSSNLSTSIFQQKQFSIISFDEIPHMSCVDNYKLVPSFKVTKKEIIFREERSSKFMQSVSKLVSGISNINNQTKVVADRFVSKFIPFYILRFELEVGKGKKGEST